MNMYEAKNTFSNRICAQVMDEILIRSLLLTLSPTACTHMECNLITIIFINWRKLC
jgi:hypothetical protein